jgi:hypothetical protein
VIVPMIEEDIYLPWFSRKPKPPYWVDEPFAYEDAHICMQSWVLQDPRIAKPVSIRVQFWLFVLFINPISVVVCGSLMSVCTKYVPSLMMEETHGFVRKRLIFQQYRCI